MGLILDKDGQKIVQRGGDASFEKLDGLDADDRMLFLELVAKAPNAEPEQYLQWMIDLRMAYGLDARRALADGHVQIERVTARDMKEPM